MKPGQDFFILPYLYHILFLPSVLFIVLFSIHSWKPRIRDIVGVSIVISILALFFRLPVDISPNVQVSSIRGPWFFWGMQEMFRYIPALLAGILIPTMFLLLVGILPWISTSFEKCGRMAIVLGAVSYLVLSIVFWIIW